MNIIDIISKKKNGRELSFEEIAFFIKGIVANEMPNYQASALLMAICIKGMTMAESRALTECMAASGKQLDISALHNTVDKHSSGGVGDSTTFVVLPVLAALKYNAVKMSGRALGHTGGTIDKLEGIGVATSLRMDDFIAQVKEIGLAVTSQTSSICPADKILYALRDVTATVDSIPLIAASIMCKKLAGGAKNIILDVKCGDGAFMRTAEDAEELARLMVDIGKGAGRNVAAVITDMSEPLDSYIGNKLEIFGAINVLNGERNALYAVSKTLVATLLSTLKINNGEALFDEVIDNGAAYNKFIDMITAQGGNIDALSRANLVNALYIDEVTADRDGYITSIGAKQIGELVCDIGAGRKTLDQAIDYNAGVYLKVRVGDKVKKGDVLAKAYYNFAANTERAKMLSGYIIIGSEKPQISALIKKVVI